MNLLKAHDPVQFTRLQALQNSQLVRAAMSYDAQIVLVQDGDAALAQLDQATSPSTQPHADSKRAVQQPTTESSSSVATASSVTVSPIATPRAFLAPPAGAAVATAAHGRSKSQNALSLRIGGSLRSDALALADLDVSPLPSPLPSLAHGGFDSDKPAPAASGGAISDTEFDHQLFAASKSARDKEKLQLKIRLAQEESDRRALLRAQL